MKRDEHREVAGRELKAEEEGRATKKADAIVRLLVWLFCDSSVVQSVRAGDTGREAVGEKKKRATERERKTEKIQ